MLKRKLVALQAGKDKVRACAQALRDELNGVAVAGHSQARYVLIGLEGLGCVPNRHGILLHRRAHNEAVCAQALSRKLQSPTVLAHGRRDDLAVRLQLVHRAFQACAVDLHGGAQGLGVSMRLSRCPAQRGQAAVVDRFGLGHAAILLRLAGGLAVLAALARAGPPVCRTEGPSPAVGVLRVALDLSGRGGNLGEVGRPVLPHVADSNACLGAAHGAHCTRVRRILCQVDGVLMPRHCSVLEFLRHNDVLLLCLQQEPIAVVLRLACRRRFRC
mmetsp:Transcript_4306/g.12554  ORF Transcript_4306/g.12554 Transcript_4306/m.12554 type:complete len:273 (-) Transcript_4306:1021-1839(-)